MEQTQESEAVKRPDPKHLKSQASRVFVSRGGLKLEHAIATFDVDPKGMTVLDIGSSTGGFVDCLLQCGAQKVYSVDTAYGELAWKLRNDPRVVVMERTNILHLTELLKERGETSGKGGGLASDTGVIDLITVDASWTKLELILPVVRKFLKPSGKVIALLKPHYQAEKKDLVKGVLAKEKVGEVVRSTLEKVQVQGWKIEAQTESPILGSGGNREFLILLSHE